MSSSPPTTTAPPGAARLSGRAWGALLVLCGALFLDALDVSMIGVALPSIRTDLHMSTSALQWVVSAYVLGYGGLLLLGGRVADLLGRRRVFLVSLAVFLAASAVGGLVHDGNLLILTRFLKGASAAFTAPSALSIITTSFAEGAQRNKALSVYSATGASGFSLGLVFSGVLTEAGWRLVLLLPVVVSAVVLAAAIVLIPKGERPAGARHFDLLGALGITSAMLLLVFTLVEAPEVGWLSARTLGSAALIAAIFLGFVRHELRTEHPLVRLGILRSASLVRANLAAMSLFGGWVGFQFVVTLYLQQLRGWSALATGLALFPAGALVALLSPRMATAIPRVGTARLIRAGLLAPAIGYALFLPIGLHSGYVLAMLPTFLLAGLGFGLAFGPMNVAATDGVAPEEQGLAGGLLNTSFQLGGALVLAIATAVATGRTGTSTNPADVLDGYRAAVAVSLVVAVFGVLATTVRSRRPSEVVAPVVELDQAV